MWLKNTVKDIDIGQNYPLVDVSRECHCAVGVCARVCVYVCRCWWMCGFVDLYQLYLDLDKT